MAVKESADQPQRVNLICFPYAGGGTSLFYRWQRALPASIHVIPVRLPGREGRIGEPALPELQSLLAELSSQLAARSEEPSVYFGHSMGALVAYAAILRHRDRNDPLPRGLIVSSCCAPQFLPRSQLYASLPDEQLFQSIVHDYELSEAESAGEAELIRLMLPTIRADFGVYESYRHQDPRPLPIPIQVLGGVNDRYAARHELESWREQTAADCRCRFFPGGHFYFRDHEKQVLAVLADACHRFAM